jgi:hypothetical protein
VDDHEAIARAAATEAGLDDDLWWYRLDGDTGEELVEDALDVARRLELHHLRQRLGIGRLPSEEVAWDEECRETEAAIAYYEARIAQERSRGNGPPYEARAEQAERAWTDARIRANKARMAASRALIRTIEERLPASLDVDRSAPRARESRPRRTRAGSGSEASRDGPSDEPPLDGRGLRLRPELLIRLPLEGTAEITLAADSYEDEWRLLRWLIASDAVLDLSVTVLRAVADLLERAE